MAEVKTVITLICERAADVNDLLDKNDQISGMPDVKVVKLPCSGMIQPLMIEAAMKAGSSGVVVCGCQIGDCYYREGNKMIRDRLLGLRPPTLKKTVDSRRVMALWLSRLQKKRFLDETKEFVNFVAELDRNEADKPKVAPKPVQKPAATAPAKPATPENPKAEVDAGAAAKPAAASPAAAATPAVKDEKFEQTPEDKEASAPGKPVPTPESTTSAVDEKAAAEGKPSLAQLKDVSRAQSAEKSEAAPPAKEESSDAGSAEKKEE